MSGQIDRIKACIHFKNLKRSTKKPYYEVRERTEPPKQFRRGQILRLLVISDIFVFKVFLFFKRYIASTSSNPLYLRKNSERKSYDVLISTRKF